MDEPRKQDNQGSLVRAEGGALDAAGRDDQLLAEQDVLGEEFLARPGQIHGEPGHERQRARDLTERGLGVLDHGRDDGSKTASERREDGTDLAQRRRSYKLVNSEMMNDPAAEQTGSQDSAAERLQGDQNSH